MAKPKFEATVYVALKDRGLSNRQIAGLLHVDEASVRRGLRGYKPRGRTHELLLELGDLIEARGL